MVPRVSLSLYQDCAFFRVPFRSRARAAAYRKHTSLVRRMIAMLINCVAEKTSAHSNLVMSVAFSPGGTMIVSGSADGTIKVWDLGALEPCSRPSLAKTDSCWLVWQSRWVC